MLIRFTTMKINTPNEKNLQNDRFDGELVKVAVIKLPS